MPDELNILTHDFRIAAIDDEARYATILEDFAMKTDMMSSANCPFV